MVTRSSWLEKEVAFFCALERDFRPFLVPPKMKLLNGITKGGVDYLRLSNGEAEAPSGGHTGGYSIRLPDAIEIQVSGRHIVIKVVARAANANHSRFAMAYSTNEAGNSGWRWFESTPDWTVYTMEWNAPVTKGGYGDFVGILPDVQGEPGTEFCYLAIAIV